MFIKHENCVINLNNVLDFYIVGCIISFYFPDSVDKGRVTWQFKSEEEAQEKFDLILQVLDAFMDLENE